MKTIMRCLFAVILAIFLAQGLVLAEEITLTTILPSSSDGGKFPKPDFDSGWVAVPYNCSPITLNFKTANLNGKRTFSGAEAADKMFVYIQCQDSGKIASTYNPGGWANDGRGALSGVGAGIYYTLDPTVSTDPTGPTTQITVYKMYSHYYDKNQAMRVWIWYLD